jgi:hypothetical protein
VWAGGARRCDGYGIWYAVCVMGWDIQYRDMRCGTLQAYERMLRLAFVAGKLGDGFTLPHAKCGMRERAGGKGRAVM